MVSSSILIDYSYSLWVIVVTLNFALWGVQGMSKQEVEHHLELGIQLLARQQMQDAIAHFHDAIDGDPTNYIGYYRRATVYLALGRGRSALKDLDEVLKLKPDFTAARSQRASVLLKLGRLDEAYIDAEAILQKDNTNEEAHRLFTTIYPLKEKIQYAHNSIDSHHYQEALFLLNEIIEECPWDANLRELRIQAQLALGDVMSAITDLKSVTKQTQDNTQGFFRLSKLYYNVGDVGQALNEIRDCLKLDPDHQACFALYKKLKKINKLVVKMEESKENQEYNKCVTAANELIKEEPDVLDIQFIGYDMLCHCETHLGDVKKASDACSKALGIREDPRLYCDRGDAYLLDDMFDEAINDFNRALNIDENYQRARQSIEKAKKLQKQAGKRDYYKILGVKRNASKREVTKAYRSLAQKWHPDHYEGEDKKKAEAKFIDIAAAKEVLTDPEKRAKFDAGEDPLDPEQQANQGFNPFQHFHFRRSDGFQQGFDNDGPFHFKFQFN